MGRVDPSGMVCSESKKAIVGTITIYSLYENPYIFIDGHSWIELTIDGETTSYGVGRNWNSLNNAINSSSDIVKNLEIERNYANKANVEKVGLYITGYQYDKIINTINTDVKNGYKWGWTDPCSDFASDIWNSISNYNLEDRGMSGLSNPDTLAESITNLKNNARNYFDNLNNTSYLQGTTLQQSNLYQNLIY